jgi:hypothetical protein
MELIKCSNFLEESEREREEISKNCKSRCEGKNSI